MRSYQEFWPFYLSLPHRPATRWLHFAGTAAAFACLWGAWLASKPWLVLAVPVVAYGFAWLSHRLVEKNRPATFRYPLWSLIADLHMVWLMLRGGLEPRDSMGMHRQPSPERTGG